jgi:hypothetical protein
MIMNVERVKVWKKKFVEYFRILSVDSSGGFKENEVKLSQEDI